MQLISFRLESVTLNRQLTRLKIHEDEIQNFFSRAISCLQYILQSLHEDFCSLILATFSDVLLVYWTYFLEVPLGNHRKRFLDKSSKIFFSRFCKVKLFSDKITSNSLDTHGSKIEHIGQSIQEWTN